LQARPMGALGSKGSAGPRRPICSDALMPVRRKLVRAVFKGMVGTRTPQVP